MNAPHLSILRGYVRLVHGLLRIALWIAALGALSALITLPLWFAASRFPTAYTILASLMVVVGAGWLIAGGRRPTGRALMWSGNLIILLAGIVLGVPALIVVACVLASGMVAHRLT